MPRRSKHSAERSGPDGLNTGNLPVDGSRTARRGRWWPAVVRQVGADGVDRAPSFRDADLRRALLSRADLRGADLRGADLTGALLRWAQLDGADLRGAILIDADFASASIVDADFADADLTGARLWETRLDGARISLEQSRSAHLVAPPREVLVEELLYPLLGLLMWVAGAVLFVVVLGGILALIAFAFGR